MYVYVCVCMYVYIYVYVYYKYPCLCMEQPKCALYRRPLSLLPETISPLQFIYVYVCQICGNVVMHFKYQFFFKIVNKSHSQDISLLISFFDY